MNRKAIRTFVLARLTTPELTGRRFEVSKKFDLNEFLKGSLRLCRGEDFDVVIELDAWAADDHDGAVERGGQIGEGETWCGHFGAMR